MYSEFVVKGEDSRAISQILKINIQQSAVIQVTDSTCTSVANISGGTAVQLNNSKHVV
jgi:hypothetical protein